MTIQPQSSPDLIQGFSRFSLRLFYLPLRSGFSFRNPGKLSFLRKLEIRRKSTSAVVALREQNFEEKVKIMTTTKTNSAKKDARIRANRPEHPGLRRARFGWDWREFAE